MSGAGRAEAEGDRGAGGWGGAGVRRGEPRDGLSGELLSWGWCDHIRVKTFTVSAV